MINRLRLVSRGLAFRIAALLALALLPIGIIALAQTLQLIEESNRRAEASLLAMTSKAAGGEEGLIRIGFGAAQALASFMPAIRDDPELCESTLNRFLKDSDAFSFAGYVNADGILACASAGGGLDLSGSERYQKMRDKPRPRTMMVRESEFSETSVIGIFLPVMNGSVYDGHISVSLPHRRLQRAFAELPGDRPVDLITFNEEGEVLTSQGGLDDVELRLPQGRPLAGFVGLPQTAFTGRTVDGQKRVFAVVPVVSNLVYAMGSWKQERLAFAPGAINLAMPVLFPVLMWLACLAIAYLAVERLVIRPTRNLRARMLLFMRSRQISPPKGGRSLSTELQEIDETWERLAGSVLVDEARLEDTIHDKNVLLKEVHHRVKNNLQLIASILNMTIRKTTAPDTKTTLLDVRNRVMSLATLHQNLYETSAEGRVRADELLHAVVGRVLNAGLLRDGGVRLDLNFEPTVLYPDQAVPLSLMASEAVTNALKYIGKPESGKPWIMVRLSDQEGAMSYLEIANSTGEPLNVAIPVSSSGLGEQLIKAFAHQLDGRLETETNDGVYRVRLWFPRPVADRRRVEGLIRRGVSDASVESVTVAAPPSRSGQTDRRRGHC